MATSPNTARVKSWHGIPTLVSGSCCAQAPRKYSYEDLALFLAPDAVPALAVLDQLHLHHAGVPRRDGARIRRARIFQPTVRAWPWRPGAVVADRATDHGRPRPHRVYLRPVADQCALHAYGRRANAEEHDAAHPGAARRDRPARVPRRGHKSFPRRRRG